MSTTATVRPRLSCRWVVRAMHTQHVLPRLIAHHASVLPSWPPPAAAPAVRSHDSTCRVLTAPRHSSRSPRSPAGDAGAGHAVMQRDIAAVAAAFSSSWNGPVALEVDFEGVRSTLHVLPTLTGLMLKSKVLLVGLSID